MTTLANYLADSWKVLKSTMYCQKLIYMAENLLNNDVKIAPVQEDIIRCLVVMSSISLKSGIVTVSVGTPLTAAAFIVQCHRPSSTFCLQPTNTDYQAQSKSIFVSNDAYCSKWCWKCKEFYWWCHSIQWGLWGSFVDMHIRAYIQHSSHKTHINIGNKSD